MTENETVDQRNVERERGVCRSGEWWGIPRDRVGEMQGEGERDRERERGQSGSRGKDELSRERESNVEKEEVEPRVRDEGSE